MVMAEKANKEAEGDAATDSGDDTPAKPKRKLPLKLIGIAAAPPPTTSSAAAAMPMSLSGSMR